MFNKSVKFIFKKDRIGYILITELCINGDLLDKSFVTKLTKRSVINTACRGVLFYTTKYGCKCNIRFGYDNIKNVDNFKSVFKSTLKEVYFMDIEV